MYTVEDIKNARKNLIELGDKTYPNQEIPRRAIRDEDIELLYGFVKKYQPKVIFEVGSWIGTSAMTMDMASEGAKIYTCDKHKVYVYESKNVTYYNCTGKTMMRLMRDGGIKADFVFIDASMSEYMGYVLRATQTNFFLAVHDFEKGKKGFNNIRALRKYVRNINVVKPRKDSTIAYVEVKRG